MLPVPYIAIVNYKSTVRFDWPKFKNITSKYFCLLPSLVHFALRESLAWKSNHVSSVILKFFLNFPEFNHPQVNHGQASRSRPCHQDPGSYWITGTMYTSQS
uniref:Uncharacterized protein n=1 Tax=Cacopsylla melanoneura TaxID=428564 RepID=A0A8D8QSV9_9HEMI